MEIHGTLDNLIKSFDYNPKVLHFGGHGIIEYISRNQYQMLLESMTGAAQKL
jgi:hypothetical protein